MKSRDRSETALLKLHQQGSLRLEANRRNPTTPEFTSASEIALDFTGKVRCKLQFEKIPVRVLLKLNFIARIEVINIRENHA
jgi:hypothetical protein